MSAAPLPFGPRLAHHLNDLLRLAWPVMLSRAGILLMAFCDMAMLGRHEVGSVGVLNLGLSIFIPVLVFSIGLATGVVPVVSQAYGRGDWRACGHHWCRAMIWSTVIAVMGSWVIWQAPVLLGWLGQAPALAESGGDVARALMPGLVAQVLFAVCAFYLEATRRPMVALVVMAGANIANAGLNWLLIWGNWGFPEMGPVGAALASTIVRFGAMGAMIAVILYQPNPHAAGVRGPWDTFWGPGGWRAGTAMRKLGLSAGLSNGFETVGFAAMTLFAGTLGPLALDAYSISHNLVATLFMVGLGLAIATGVRVGIETGRGNPSEAAFAGWTGVATALGIMATLGVAVFLGRHHIAAVYTDEPVLQARVAMLFMFSALVFVPDTMQVVLGQAVRALGDAWVAIGAYLLAFLVLMVPLGWMMLDVFGWDERGLVVAIIICCLLAGLMLGARFRVLTLREQAAP